MFPPVPVVQLKYKTKAADVFFKIPTEEPVKESDWILTAAHAQDVSDFQDSWIIKASGCGEGCMEHE